MRFKILDSFANVVTGLGTPRAHTAGERVEPRRRLSLAELDMMQQSAFVRHCVQSLADAASTKVTVSSQTLDVAAIMDRLSELKATVAFLEADRKAALYGGAAVWMIFEGDEGKESDTSLPYDPARDGALVRLLVLDRWELQPQAGLEHGSILDPNPTSKLFMTPSLYLYTPQNGASLAATRQIHASRLIRFYGPAAPARYQATYQYWGTPVLEGILEELEGNRYSNQGGANILYEFGGKKLRLDNLTELLAAKDGTHRLTKYLGTQQRAFSMLRAWLVGPGYDVEPITMSLSGWADIKDRLDLQLVAALGDTVTRVFGQAPGGLSTDDQAGRKNFAARVERHQTAVLIPAYDDLVEHVLLGEGIDPAAHKWTCSVAPYEPESEGEEAKRLGDLAGGLIVLLTNGVIDVQEARAAINSSGFSFLQLEQIAQRSGLSQEQRDKLSDLADRLSPPATDEGGTTTGDSERDSLSII